MIARSILLLFAALAAACAERRDSDASTAAEIERQVAAAHPYLDLRRYARFYARRPGEKVAGYYFHANEGHQPLAGTAGTSVWVAPEDVPVIHDAGCGLLLVAYDGRTRRVTSVKCEASEDDGGIVPLEQVKGVPVSRR